VLNDLEVNIYYYNLSNKEITKFYYIKGYNE
jgi:hypothetical protein